MKKHTLDYTADVYPLIFHPVSDHLYDLTYPCGTITVDAREWVLKDTEKEIEDMAQDVIVQGEREEKNSLILYFCIEKHLFDNYGTAPKDQNMYGWFTLLHRVFNTALWEYYGGKDQSTVKFITSGHRLKKCADGYYLMDEDEMTTEATFAELTWIKDYILDRNGTYKKQDLFKDTLYFIDHIYDPAYEFTVSEIVKEIRYLKANFKDRKTLEQEKKLEKKKNKEDGNRLFSSYLEQKFEECAKKENMELNAFKTKFRSEWLLPVISGPMATRILQGKEIELHRNIVLLIALLLRMNVYETQMLFELGDLEYNELDCQEAILMFLIERKIDPYNETEMQEIMDEMGCMYIQELAGFVIEESEEERASGRKRVKQ